LTDSFSISLQKWMAFSWKIIGFHSTLADRVVSLVLCGTWWRRPYRSAISRTGVAAL
jgi:hypothetical protein